MQYATLAGDNRTAKLAAQKAVDLLLRASVSSVKKLVKQCGGGGDHVACDWGDGKRWLSFAAALARMQGQRNRHHEEPA